MPGVVALGLMEHLGIPEATALVIVAAPFLETIPVLAAQAVILAAMGIVVVATSVVAVAEVVQEFVILVLPGLAHVVVREEIPGVAMEGIETPTAQIQELNAQVVVVVVDDAPEAEAEAEVVVVLPPPETREIPLVQRLQPHLIVFL